MAEGKSGDDHPTRREAVIDAALDRADRNRLVATQHDFLRSGVRGADRTPTAPRTAKK